MSNVLKIDCIGVCDVLCQEDTCLRRGGNAPTIWVIIHCFMLTTVRRHDYRTIHQGQGVLSSSYSYRFSSL